MMSCLVCGALFERAVSENPFCMKKVRRDFKCLSQKISTHRIEGMTNDLSIKNTKEK